MSDRRPSSLERAVKHTEFDPKWHRLDLKVRAVGGCPQEDRCQIFENRFQKLKLRDNQHGHDLKTMGGHPGSKAQKIWPELTDWNWKLEPSEAAFKRTNVKSLKIDFKDQSSLSGCALKSAMNHPTKYKSLKESSRLHDGLEKRRRLKCTNLVGLCHR